VGGVVVERDRSEVGVGKLEVGHVSAINLKLELIGVTEHGYTATVTSGEVFHRVIEVQLLHLRARGNSLLDLGDEHILGLGGEDLTLLGVEIGVIGIDLPLVRGGTRTPSDTQFYIVILKTDKRYGCLPVLTESKTEGIEALVGGTTVEITSDRLGGRGGRERGSDESGVSGILVINNLAPH